MPEPRQYGELVVVKDRKSRYYGEVGTVADFTYPAGKTGYFSLIVEFADGSSRRFKPSHLQSLRGEVKRLLGIKADLSKKTYVPLLADEIHYPPKEFLRLAGEK